MKQSPLSVLSVALVLAALGTGCEQSSDLPGLRGEASGIVKHYKHRFDELQRRLDAADQRRGAVGVTSPDAVNANRVVATARANLATLGQLVAQGPTAIDASAKKGPDELRRLMYEMKERLGNGDLDVTWEIHALESWLANAEAVASRAAPAAPPEPPSRDPGEPSLVDPPADTATPPPG
jgi:hypothetical protein